MLRRLLLVVAMTLAALPSIGSAQEYQVVSVHRRDARSPLEFTVSGGSLGFTGGLAPRLNVGPAWGAGVLYRPVPALGLELVYAGSNSFISGTSSRALLNAGSFNVRLSPLPTALEPYAFAGFGVGFSTIVNNAQFSGYSSTSNAIVPLGLGLDLHLAHLLLGLRGSYVPFLGKTFGPTDTAAGAWTASLVFGGGV